MPEPPITCSGCRATWTAIGAAHCGSCHRDFSATGLFDRHRSARGDHGGCVDPRTIFTPSGDRVMFFRNGRWAGPEMTEADKARRGLR
jgi:hypothetical protein